MEQIMQIPNTTFPSIPVLLVSYIYVFSAAPRSESVLTYRIKDEQIFQNFGSHLKILGASKVTQNKFHTQNPQMLGVTAQSSVTWVMQGSGFVHPCTIYSSCDVRNKASCTHKTNEVIKLSIAQHEMERHHILNSTVASIL